MEGYSCPQDFKYLYYFVPFFLSLVASAQKGVLKIRKLLSGPVRSILDTAPIGLTLVMIIPIRREITVDENNSYIIIESTHQKEKGC